MKATIFVSGPISSRHRDERRANVSRGILCAQLLESHGFRVISPHRDIYPRTLQANGHGLTETQALRECFRQIRTETDAILFLHGWEISKGCRRERQYALSLNALRPDRPVGFFFDIDQLMKAYP